MATPLTDAEITQLRELLNNTNPLKDQPTLDVASEATTAILGAVHDDTEQGRLRKLGFAIAHQALQEANPLQLTIEDVVLFENSNASGVLTTSITTVHNLDIKQGTTRHNFNDGYFGFTFVTQEANFTSPNPDRVDERYFSFVSKDRWFNTQTSLKAITIIFHSIGHSTRVWKASDNGFFAINPATLNQATLKRIIGHKLTLALQTPA